MELPLQPHNFDLDLEGRLTIQGRVIDLCDLNPTLKQMVCGQSRTRHATHTDHSEKHEDYSVYDKSYDAHAEYDKYDEYADYGEIG